MSRTGLVKRLSALLLILVLMVTSCLISGCGSGGDNDQSTKSSAQPGTVVAETDEELTVVDQAGREVTVKKDPESIALCYGVVVRFLLNLGVGDRIKGIGKTEPFLEQLQPSLKDCTDVGKGVADIEALAELSPDLFIHKAADTETLEAVQKIGIPSVGIEVETPEDMLTALKLLGTVCGAEDRAEELSDYYSSSISGLKKLSGSLSEEDRKTAIVMGSSIGKVADSTMLQGLMLETAGAVNCASEISASELWPTAGTEQIFSWDPDYIFITAGASYTAEDIYSDPAWSEMKAVKEHHVNVMPSGLDSWEFPGIVSAIGIEYMISVMYPDLVTDDQLEQDVAEFYRKAYGAELSRKELGY